MELFLFCLVGSFGFGLDISVEESFVECATIEFVCFEKEEEVNAEQECEMDARAINEMDRRIVVLARIKNNESFTTK